MKKINKIITLLFILLLCGCSQKAEDVKRAQVNIVLGLHSNSKDMSVECLDDQIKNVLLANDEVDINFIVLDGDPYIAYELNINVPEYVSNNKKNQLVDTYSKEIFNITREFEPKSENTDVFEAFKLSSYLAEDEKYDCHYLFIIDTMLSTAGIIDFSSFDFMNVDISEILEFLNCNYSIDLYNYDLINIYGLGQTDAPQKDLSDAYLSKLESFYTEFVKTAGYKNDSDSIIKHNAIFGTTDEMTYRNFPSIKVVEENSNDKTFISAFDSVTTIDCDTYFEADSAIIRDDINIKNLLEQLEQFDKNTRYIICGTTSSYGEEKYRIELSKDRASTIRNLMISDLGFNSELLEIYPGSINTSFYTTDRDVNGKLIENIAATNRKVYILINNEESYRLLNNES